jgi:hypothetical protein
VKIDLDYTGVILVWGVKAVFSYWELLLCADRASVEENRLRHKGGAREICSYVIVSRNTTTATIIEHSPYIPRSRTWDRPMHRQCREQITGTALAIVENQKGNTAPSGPVLRRQNPSDEAIEYDLLSNGVDTRMALAELATTAHTRRSQQIASASSAVVLNGIVLPSSSMISSASTEFCHTAIPLFDVHSNPR